MKKHVTMTWMLMIFAVSACFGGTITREYHQEHRFSGELVSVKTVNGKIFVETWSKDRVDVYAEIEVRSSNKGDARKFMQDVEVVVRDRGDELEIKVDRPNSKGGNFWDWVAGSGRPNLIVNFSIKVPEEMNIEAASTNGMVEVVDVEGNVSISTTNGKIHADNIGGPVEAYTTNGSIFVDIRTDEPDDNIVLHTVNGSIKLALDKDIEADVEASTVNGSIKTDFPLEVSGKWGPKNVSGEINGGGSLIELETVNGSISLIER
jgi:DUF4097 and DUF4098 domain-containing protein YvlB